MLGYFTAGAQTFVLNGQHLLLLSNGLDLSPQPLALQPQDLSQRPTWFSTDIDYLGRLVQVDLDRDGRLDAVVPTLIDHALQFRGGVLKVYRGTAEGLERSPAQTVASGGSLTIAAGDADGDGDTDVVVAMMASEGSLGQLPPPSAGPIKLFLNEAGALREQPSWTAPQPASSYVGGLQFADADQDGLMDLIAAGDRLKIYYGERTKTGSVLAAEPGWTSSDTWQVGYDVAWSKSGADAPFQVVISATCVSGFASCGSTPQAPYRAYRPVRSQVASTEPIWKSSTRELGGGIALRDFDADGFVDLAASAIDIGGQPLTIYPGTQAGFAAQTAYQSAQNVQGVSVSVAALDGSTRRVSEAITAVAGGHVVTLRWPTERLVGVSVQAPEQGSTARTLTERQISFVPGAALFSVSEPLREGSTVNVQYDVIEHPSLIVSDSQSPGGAVIFLNQSTADAK
jgi:hypothetical protein